MRALLALVPVLSVAGSSLLLLGCEASDCEGADGRDAVCLSSLKAFEGEEQTHQEDYTDGASVTVHGSYGDIAIVRGSAGVVSTTFKPFNYRGHDKEAEALAEIEDNLELEASADIDGNITVTTDRSESKTGALGSHITIALPPEFNGVLIVRNDGDGTINQGHVSVGYVGQATTLNVINRGLENCNILRPEDDDDAVPASTLTETDVRCEADITVRGVTDNVIVRSENAKFHSNVLVEIASIGPDATGGEIVGDNSSIELRLPASGDFEVSASASGPDAHVGKLETGDCETTASDDVSVELSCGAGGPVYTVSADDGDDGDNDVSFVNVLVK